MSEPTSAGGPWTPEPGPDGRPAAGAHAGDRADGGWDSRWSDGQWGGADGQWGNDQSGGGQWGAPAGSPSGSPWGAPLDAAPRPGVVPLRPLGLGEMLDGALGLVRGYPLAALGVSAAVALVEAVVQLVVLLTLLRPVFDLDTTTLQPGDDAFTALLAGVGGAGLVTFVVSTIANAVMTGLMSAIAGKAVLGQPLSLAELWASTRGRLARLIGGALLFGVLVFVPPVVAGLLAALLVVVAGPAGGVVGALLVLGSLGLSVLVYVRLSLSTSVIALEDARVVRSFRRSWALVRRASWRVLGVLVLALVVSGFVSSVLQAPFDVLGGQGGPVGAVMGGASGASPSTRSLVLTTIGAGVAAAVVAPFVAGVRALLYVDRRMRAEGLDVALQAAAAHRP